MDPNPEPHSPSPTMMLDGEFLAVSERVIVAPTVGRFVAETATGSHVRVGQTVGAIVRPDCETPVRSSFAGRFMGHLAETGQRVRDGQPLAWVRLVG